MNIKRTVFVILSFVLGCLLFAQTNTTVDVNDEIYYILSNAEARGLCTTLSKVRPYTEKYILKKLDEILGNLSDEEAEEIGVTEANEDAHIAEDVETFSVSTLTEPNVDENVSEPLDGNAEDHKNNIEKNAVKRKYKESAEYALILREKERFVHKKGFDVRHLSYRVEGGKEKFPLSFEVGDSIVGLVSGGVYSKADSSVGYELFDNVNFYGDLGKNISYYATGYFGLTLMPLQEMGTYGIGYWWYDGDESNKYDTSSPDYITAERTRIVKTFRNRSVIPYTYSKYWDGNVFFLSNMTTYGNEGWAFVNSLGFGMLGEIHASFLDNKIEIGASRLRREWAAMDDGASLVLNASARPFFCVDLSIRPFKFISLSALTGILEPPKQDYINSAAWKDDTYHFQNAFTVAELDLDFKYVHFDFGSSVIWPKRLDLGYMFPLIDRVIYQDNMGDFDNLALFANVKVRYPGLGSIWFSGYLDEIPSSNPIKVLKNVFSMTRYMFAFQLGMNANIPFVPFGKLSFRYTKIEPYCYTHHSINYTPWYKNHYISESYTNNGESLGYYLPPNSDEIHIKFQMRPSAWSMAALQYQLVRHGADYGSRHVEGSSLYSELPNEGRDNLRKYFLRDGAYEWTNIVSLCGSYDFKQFKVPVVLNCSLGFVYSSFTDTNSALGEKGDYHKIDTDEYSAVMGFVATLGFTIFGR